MKNSLVKVVTVVMSLSLVVLVAPAQRDVQITGVRRMPRGLTMEKVRKHVIAPAHTRGIEIEKENDNEPVYKVEKKPKTQYKTKIPKLNVNQFGTNLDGVLKNSTAGYALEIRQNGTPIYGLVRGWAHRPQDGSLGWNGSVRMHVASVSKMLTAMGMIKLLDSKGISLDKEIIGYLPAYWDKGANINKITFRHLLTHTSGLGTLPQVGGGESSASDFAFMKQNIELGVPAPGSVSKYQNVNFGLMRILMAVINGDIDTDFNPPASFRDGTWDILTIEYYRDYMQDHVFTPAGVSNVGFAPPPNAANGALAYAFPPGDGWNSGDMSTVAGGAGWRLSVQEVLNVMNHFRRKGTIVSTTRAKQIMDAGLGYNGVNPTPAGTMYYKKGRWKNGGRQEMCIAYFLPDNIEMVIFVNSPIFEQGFSLHEIVRDLYLNALE